MRIYYIQNDRRRQVFKAIERKNVRRVPNGPLYPRRNVLAYAGSQKELEQALGTDGERGFELDLDAEVEVVH